MSPISEIESRLCAAGSFVLIEVGSCSLVGLFVGLSSAGRAEPRFEAQRACCSVRVCAHDDAARPCALSASGLAAGQHSPEATLNTYNYW